MQVVQMVLRLGGRSLWSQCLTHRKCLPRLPRLPFESALSAERKGLTVVEGGGCETLTREDTSWNAIHGLWKTGRRGSTLGTHVEVGRIHLLKSCLGKSWFRLYYESLGVWMSRVVFVDVRESDRTCLVVLYGQ